MSEAVETFLLPLVSLLRSRPFKSFFYVSLSILFITLSLKECSLLPCDFPQPFDSEESLRYSHYSVILHTRVHPGKHGQKNLSIYLPIYIDMYMYMGTRILSGTT